MKSSKLLLSLVALTVALPTFADPPDHAPAHGRRAKERGEHPGRKHRGGIL